MNKCISEAIAEALEADLASGRWKRGERLPSVDELRARFGAGEYAVRRAIRRLADSGAISVKKHVGAVVTAKPFWSWRGRVAFVAVGAMGSYFQQMLSIRFAQVFEPAGCHGFRLGGDYLEDRLPGETRYFVQSDDQPTASFDGKYASVQRCYGGNYISGLYGAGGWIGSVVELARLVSAIDGVGPVPDLLEPFSIRQMTVWYDDETYGLGWLDCRPEGEWTRTGSFAGTSALIKKYADGETWIFVTNTSTWRGSRFSRNTGALCFNLRSRFDDQLPKRDLFRSN